MNETFHPSELSAFNGAPASMGDVVLSRVGAAIDRSVVLAAQRLVDSMLMPAEDELPAMVASAHVMRSPALQGEPGRFFAFEPADLEPTSVDRRPGRSLDRGRVERTRLHLHYRPYPQSGVPPETRTIQVPFERWIHDGPPAATVIAIHGFTMGTPRVDSLVLMARQWFRAGLDVALVTLPHHGRRAPRDARFSGEAFAVPHVGRLSEAVRQAAFELLALRRWLAAEAEAPVGALGLSLGGYLTALLAGLDPELAFAVPMAPPVCIGDLAWHFFERSQTRRADTRPAFDRDELREAYRVHSPLSHAPRIPRERLLVVAGRGDRIVPPEHPQSLYLHWGQPAIHWFSGSHLAPFGRGAIVRAVVRHWRSLGLV